MNFKPYCFFLPIKMFAFEDIVAKEILLPLAIESTVAGGVVTNQSSIMANQKGKTISLQPDGNYTPDDPRRQSNIDMVLQNRERNMRIREEVKRADEERKRQEQMN